MSEKELINKLRYMICKKKPTEEICIELNVDLSQLHELVIKLRMTNDSYGLVDGELIKDPALKNPSGVFSIKPANKELVCFVSDIHYGSIYDRPDLIKKIYRLCDCFDIDTIICCGDLTDGYYPRRSSYAKYQKVSSAREMLEYVVNVHPYMNGITFYTIGGNHDRTFMDSDHVDIINQIAMQRRDIVYLGQDKANISFDNVKIHLYHGYGRFKKNVDSRARKYYNMLSEEENPDIIQLGHIHHSFCSQIDQTTILQTAALIDQAPLLDEKGYSCERSCWFATLKYDDDGNLIEVIPSLQEFNQAKKRVRVVSKNSH